MALEELIARGGELMLIGMGVVFAFLALLVLTVHLVSLTIRRLEARHHPQSDRAVPDDGAPEPEVIAVIAAALKCHRLHQDGY